MDLILLKPGNQTVFGGDSPPSGFETGGSTISNDGTEWEWDPGITDYFTPGTDGVIELVSVHQGMKQQVTTDVSNSARTSGRPVITEFTCVKYVDKTSIKFYDYCLRAKPLDDRDTPPTSIFVCRNSGDAMILIMRFQVRYALVSEIQFQSHPDDMPTEQFKLNFAEIMWDFTVQNPDSKWVPGKKASGWSLMKNGPIGAFSQPGP